MLVIGGDKGMGGVVVMVVEVAGRVGVGLIFVVICF